MHKNISNKPQSFGENVLWIDGTKLDFISKSNQLYVYKIRKNEHHTCHEIWRELSYARLLCYIWYMGVWTYAEHYEVS